MPAADKVCPLFLIAVAARSSRFRGDALCKISQSAVVASPSTYRLNMQNTAAIGSLASGLSGLTILDRGPAGGTDLSAAAHAGMLAR